MGFAEEVGEVISVLAAWFNLSLHRNPSISGLWLCGLAL
jgi:hypothetical protein